ncbi:hypothetical protein ACFWD1_27455 [Micromonospora chalcea]
MLPIALTCPVWWVARWTARMLASLAVVVACSFGTATLPAGAAPAAPVVVAGPAYASTPAAPRPEPDRTAERQGRPAAAPAPAARATDTLPAGPQPVPAGRITAPVGLRAPPAR